jgi:hypothetical protein
MVIKHVQVRANTVPQIVAAVRRQDWSFLMTDSRGGSVWVAPDTKRELTFEASVGRERVLLTLSRYGAGAQSEVGAARQRSRPRPAA